MTVSSSIQFKRLSRMIGPQQQNKPKKQKRNLICSAIFSLSGFTSLLFVLLLSQFSVASFDFCVFFHLWSLVFYSIVRIFHFFLIFRSFPLVEGPHSDILSRTRFSVFLRISFGVSSSSSSSIASDRHQGCLARR